MTSCRTGTPAAAGTRRPASRLSGEGYTRIPGSLERPRYTPGPAGASGKVCAGSDSLDVSYQEGESLSPAPCLVSPAKTPAALHPLPLAHSHRLKTCVLCTPILFILLASISFPSDSWRAIDAPGCRLPHFESWSVCDPKATILSNLCFLVFKMGILVMYVPPDRCADLILCIRSPGWLSW